MNPVQKDGEPFTDSITYPHFREMKFTPTMNTLRKCGNAIYAISYHLETTLRVHARTLSALENPERGKKHFTFTQSLRALFGL